MLSRDAKIREMLFELLVREYEIAKIEESRRMLTVFTGIPSRISGISAGLWAFGLTPATRFWSPRRWTSLCGSKTPRI
jgi:hypothetical protein